MDELKIKQQVIDKLKQAEKVLVTVSKNPSVDELSAALGLTLLLDAQGKYATAIFSGETPPALAFLEPEKTFDDTTDSLRDFIIALNKEKADHLRYKVVDDAVKIFITPYKTTITEEDLEFSQGDYNVELVVAIGVDSQEDLDAALDNHGQILHDAAIVTVSAGDQSSTLGGIDWRDAGASSLSEMVASLVDSLRKDKKENILTAPIATALLTGIVAQTDRFSNERTSSKAMTIAATLMAAGADQQLIATELQSAEAPEVSDEDQNDSSDDGESVSVETPAATSDAKGGLSIHHDPSDRPVKKEKKTPETLEELDHRVRGKSQEEIITEEAKQAAESPDPEYVSPAEAPVLEEAPAEVAPVEVPQISQVHSVLDATPPVQEAPLMGGTLNAAGAQAEDDAQQMADASQNNTILSHQFVPESAAPTVEQPQVSEALAEEAPAPQADLSSLTDAAASIAVSGERVIEPLHEALESIQSAPEVPAPNAYGVAVPDSSLPMPPPIPDFSQVGAVGGPALPLPPMEQPQILGDIFNPATSQSVDAAASGAYAVDGDNPVASPSATVPVTPVPVDPVQPSGAYAPQSTPGQFQIPTQQ